VRRSSFSPRGSEKKKKKEKKGPPSVPPARRKHLLSGPSKEREDLLGFFEKTKEQRRGKSRQPSCQSVVRSTKGTGASEIGTWTDRIKTGEKEKDGRTGEAFIEEKDEDCARGGKKGKRKKEKPRSSRPPPHPSPQKKKKKESILLGRRSREKGEKGGDDPPRPTSRATERTLRPNLTHRLLKPATRGRGCVDDSRRGEKEGVKKKHEKSRTRGKTEKNSVQKSGKGKKKAPSPLIHMVGGSSVIYWEKNEPPSPGCGGGGGGKGGGGRLWPCSERKIVAKRGSSPGGKKKKRRGLSA